ncbi:MAG: hypothetical protein ACRDFW_14490 [bacterium]
MCVLYRVAGPSNNMVERTGPGRPAAHHARYVSGKFKELAAEGHRAAVVRL